jgi:hypothetical protein
MSSVLNAQQCAVLLNMEFSRDVSPHSARSDYTNGNTHYIHSRENGKHNVITETRWLIYTAHKNVEE